MRIALALAMVAFAADASAQDDAQAAFDEGVQALRVEQYEQAAAAFQRSYELEAKAETACNLALTYDRWEGHSEDAIDAYLQCAQDDEDGRFRDHALARASALRSERHPAEAEELPPAEDEGAGEETDEGDEGDEGDAVPVVDHQDAGDAPPPRSHALLLVGGAAAVVGLALVAGGAVAAGKGRDRIDQLRIDYPDGVITDPEGAAILDDAEGFRSRALGLYISGGIIAAAGIALAAIDLARGSSEDGVAIAPTRGGAMATLRLSFD